MATVKIPAPLRRFTQNRSDIPTDGANVGEVLKSLCQQFPVLEKHLYTEDHQLRNFVTLFLNSEDIRSLQGLDTPVQEGDEISIVPAIAGGMREDGPILTPEEILRYSRHLIMPEVGMEGQKKLKSARVLVIGMGGLGCPVSTYLTLAGVGTLGILDFDRVELSNLQRQPLYGVEDVGKLKVEVAKKRLNAINPLVHIEMHPVHLTSKNAMEVLQGYDFVVDGTDNFPTRYLVNDACVLLKKPYVYGSIFRFEGQVTVFGGEGGPCYRCLYPEPPPPGLVPSCAEGGVLGVLPGFVGAWQALEALKLILRAGESLKGRFILIDAFLGRVREFKIHPDPQCPACGHHPTIHQLIDYEEFCGVRGAEQTLTLGKDWEITPQELKNLLEMKKDVVILDVREPAEYEICHLSGSRLIPLGELPYRLGELDTSEDIVIHCHTGSRSARAVQFLRQIGFTRVKNLKGGIDAWAEQVEPSMPRY